MNVSELPSTWIWIELDKISEIVGGGTPSRNNSAYFGGDILWATPTDVTALDNLWIKNTKEKITQTGLRNSSAKLLPPGTVLMTSRATIGATAIAHDSIATNQGFANFICNENFLNNEYLAYWLPSIKSYLLNLAGGTTFKEIAKSTLKKIKIPLPSLQEQRRIVAILQEANELRALRQQANEKTKQFIPSLFQEMFREVDDFWEECRLNDVIKKLSPGKSFAAISQPAREGKFGVLKVSAVTKGVFKPEENKELPDNLSFPTDYEVKNGDLIISRANTQELVGASVIVRNTRRGLLRSDKLWKIILYNEPKINVYFLWALLNTPKLRREIGNRSTGTSSSMRNISQDKFLDIQIKLPPKPLQDEFEEKVKLLWEQKDDQENSANKLDSLFQSLLAQAFTGELTATWREQHEEELAAAAAAAERDCLLQISQPVDVEELTDDEASETKTSELHRDRYELLQSLSKNQRKIYELVIQETVYFTPEYLEEKHSISRSLAQKSLQLLAGTGLIVPITLPTLTSSGLRYELAYRNLNKDDNTQYTDDELLTKDAV